MTIYPIRAFQDNYIWAIHDKHNLVVVDPGDAQPVLDYCQQQQLTLVAVLITHHHRDHTGGIAPLKSAFPQATVIGPDNPAINGIEQVAGDGETIFIAPLALHFQVLAIPGHTLDHIAYYGHGAVFCGDTLFHTGCGRLFEGSPEQMLASLNKLAALPDATRVYCTHEYTEANLAFAAAVEPNYAPLQDMADSVAALRTVDLPSLPTNIAEQKRINPFLRCNEPGLAQAVASWSKQPATDELATFTLLRQWKDQF
ncbi:hydroxyacylglutathione hydrolase [Neiella sp. HB171785]|uniref:Hydroxyacylglutathione hydrolase n=1 Tax=Neiella litorisoli TaxID=2771431 RepID=A0A8J6QN11_9GAMM|nr:hydroxyacylglutathione hydrolase [Neiella litorisoli]